MSNTTFVKSVKAVSNEYSWKSFSTDIINRYTSLIKDGHSTEDAISGALGFGYSLIQESIHDNEDDDTSKLEAFVDGVYELAVQLLGASRAQYIF